jgi:hypothetical protein
MESEVRGQRSEVSKDKTGGLERWSVMVIDGRCALFLGNQQITNDYSADFRTLFHSIASSGNTVITQANRNREALKILLQSRNCWCNDEPEIPEEISARFDLTLDEARRICILGASSPFPTSDLRPLTSCAPGGEAQ